MKMIVTILTFLYAAVVFAQKNIEGLVKAEKSFAAYAVAHSVKEAFLEYIDSNGLVFENAEAVNGREYWNKREKRPGVLNWYPDVAAISSGNDFGFTSGPWTFQSAKNDTVIARGRYTTVWHFINGEWKFLIDLGVNSTPENSNQDLKILTRKKFVAGTSADLESAINQFYQDRKDGKSLEKYYASVFLLNRDNEAGYIGPYQKNLFKEQNAWQQTGWKLAAAGDMAFTFGKIQADKSPGNFLLIWRCIGRKWKIIAEVISG